MIVKVCGICGVEQAAMVLDAGADWIGLNLVGGLRRIDLRTAEEILASLTEPERAVVLWEVGTPTAPTGDRGPGTKPHADDALDQFRRLGVRRLQVYGVATAASAVPIAVRDLTRLSERGFETILVRHITDDASIAECGAFLKECCVARPQYVLLDAATKGRLGGTGRRLDWKMLRAARESGRFADWPPIILAGGLTPENVREAIEAVRPFGVDVSSGVESAPGLKTEAAVRAFSRAAHPSSC